MSIALKRITTRGLVLTLVVPIAAVGAILVPSSLGAAAGPPTTLPPCPSPPGILDEISVEWPSLLAWGRQVRIAIDASNAQGFLELWVADQYVGSVNPEEGTDDPYAPFWVRADRGDQDVPLRFRYGSQDSALPYKAGGNCYREAAKTVPAGRGRLLPYGVRYRSREGLLAFVAPAKISDSISGCAPYARVPAQMEIRTLRKTRVLRISDQCRDRGERLIRGRGWSGTTFNFDGFQQEFWLFMDRYEKLARQRIHVRVVAGGQLLVKRLILVRRRQTPGYRIWQGTDAFVNVCINQLREIRSSGGRLYCDIPGSYSMSVRIIRG